MGFEVYANWLQTHGYKLWRRPGSLRAGASDFIFSDRQFEYVHWALLFGKLNAPLKIYKRPYEESLRQAIADIKAMNFSGAVWDDFEPIPGVVDAGRAGGDVPCELCGFEYRRHPLYMGELSYDKRPFLFLLCDRRLVKL